MMIDHSMNTNYEVQKDLEQSVNTKKSTNQRNKKLNDLWLTIRIDIYIEMSPVWVVFVVISLPMQLVLNDVNHHKHKYFQQIHYDYKHFLNYQLNTEKNTNNTKKTYCIINIMTVRFYLLFIVAVMRMFLCWFCFFSIPAIYSPWFNLTKSFFRSIIVKVSFEFHWPISPVRNLKYKTEKNQYTTEMKSKRKVKELKSKILNYTIWLTICRVIHQLILQNLMLFFLVIHNILVLHLVL